MSRYVVAELQRVMAIRVVDADSEEEAYEIFCEGEGTPTGADGNVTGFDLLSITLEAES